MAKNKEEKTNVMRTLEQKKIPYTAFSYDPDGPIDGVSVAAETGLDAASVFKTLVTKGASGAYYVFDIPVAENLDLKKAAKAVGEKSIAMLPQKELLPLTGYVHGGCSPVGMKKQFPPGVHETGDELEVSEVSADGERACSDRRLRRKDRPSGAGEARRPAESPPGENSGCDRIGEFRASERRRVSWLRPRGTFAHSGNYLLRCPKFLRCLTAGASNFFF